MDWSSEARRCPGGVPESALLGNQPGSRPGRRASRQRGLRARQPGTPRGAEELGFPDAGAEHARFRDAGPPALLAKRREAPILGRAAPRIPRSPISRTPTAMVPGFGSSRQSAGFLSRKEHFSAARVRGRDAWCAASRRDARAPGRGRRVRAVLRRRDGRPSRQMPRSADSRTRRAEITEKRRFADANCHGSEIRRFSAIGRIPVSKDGLLGRSASGTGRRASREAPSGADSRTRAASTRDSETRHRQPFSPDADKGSVSDT